ncbi:MAG: endonuclease/exonuclease/phosphatase family protein [Acetobacterales bacterium]
MPTAEIILAVPTLLLVLVTLAPLSSSKQWWIRGCEFPRLQFAALALFLAVASTTTIGIDGRFAQGLAAVALACLAWQASWIVPYTRLWPTEVPAVRGGTDGGGDGGTDGGRLRLLVSNVLMDNRRADLLRALVAEHRPDILLTLESNHWWEAQMAPVEEEMPHCVKHALDNTYGMHLYSRLPLEDCEVRYLVNREVPSIRATAVLPSGIRVQFHCLHPEPPAPQENTESADRDRELLITARAVKECGEPVVVIGDLNDVAWSWTTRRFRKVSGLRDPRRGRGMFNSFHARYPFLRWPLDHVFHSSHFALVRMLRLPSIGSDHFPILAELALGGDRPGSAARRGGAPARSDDRGPGTR